MSLPVVFHRYLGELYHNNDNIPLSCFTSCNLEYINTLYSQLAMKKLNAEAPGEKQKSVMDTTHFEENRLKESALNRGQWQEAARNFCAFVEEISGDPDSKASKRWQAHFGFFDNTEDAEDNFPTILLANITLRMKYWARPFTFERELYVRELDKAAMTTHLAELERRWSSAQPPTHVPWTPIVGAQVPAAPPSQRGQGGGFGGRGRGGGRGGALFQGGGGGEHDPATVICLLCGKQGHLYASCSATTFADNTAIYAGASS
jgi:uncharacterized membrane protein YgcG